MTRLYIMKAPDRHLFKIGISTSTVKRSKQVAETPAKIVLSLPFFYAAKWELFLHRRYAHLRRVYGKKSGKNEWFYFWLPIRPMLWMVGFWLLEWGSLVLLIGFLIWL